MMGRDGLRQLEQLRFAQPCFGPDAAVSTWDTHSQPVLALVRSTQAERLVCLFNFAGTPEPYALDAMEGEFTDLVTGESVSCTAGVLEPYQYRLCLKQ